MQRLLIPGAALLIVLVMFISGYNTLVGMNEYVDLKWAQVDNQLQRRADLVPNLVNTVKGYAAHEQGAIQAVADARARLAGARTPSESAQADGELSGALSRLLMVAENYPNLKADQNFRALQDELSGTENRLAVARKDYNEAVQTFNTKLRVFPAMLYASAMGFTSRDYFKVEESAKAVPEVKF